jgi:hypothetical protein
MPRDSSRSVSSRRPLVPSVPDKPTPDAAVLAMLQDHGARLDELLRLTRAMQKRGRPRDAYVDVADQMREIAVLALREAFETVKPRILLSAHVTTDLAALETLVVQAFQERLVGALAATDRWHFKHQRKVNDPAHAMRDANRRRDREIS